MIFIIITILLLLPYSILILYYRNSWLAISNFNLANRMIETELPDVSIIIAARNEEKNIGDCIRSVINQSYPQQKLEVIIVDDHSTDATVSVINEFQKENIRVIRLADFLENKKINSYKKKSIEMAMNLAKGELIVSTDADCIAPRKWIETLVAFYKEKYPVFVALPVAFSLPSSTKRLGPKLLEIFQSLDFMTLQGITGASVHKKFHAMSNGANLAYKKSVFYEVNGFKGIDGIASGDDMLLMHKIRERYPDKIMYLKSPDVIVETTPAATFKEFINQRIRWASKADKYADKKIKAVLLLVYLFNAWILILGVSSIFYQKSLYLLLLAIGAKAMVEMFFLYPVSKFFKKEKMLWWFIPAQPFHIVYTLVAGWLGAFGTYQWKGRRVK